MSRAGSSRPKESDGEFRQHQDLDTWPRFAGIDEFADVAVLVVTFNSERDIDRLLTSLRQEAQDQSMKVIVADNSPTPWTLDSISQHEDVLAFSTGGNFGYAAAINAALKRAGEAGSYLVLNPDLRVQRGAVLALRRRMAVAGAGVVVPRLLDEDGTVYPSLRREPSLSRALGDALLGSKVPGRPGWLSEIDYAAASYRHSHPIDWATGAALLIRSDVAGRVGGWDERYFLYSEETDFMRRVRAGGFSIWFEPSAKMVHARGGSGSSPLLDALLGANRIRYVRKFHPVAYARAFRAVVVFSALLRAPLSGRRRIFGLIARESRWKELPHAAAFPALEDGPDVIPYGAIIIPAHNEVAVLRRTLEALTLPLASGRVEVIVVCNGCTDGTEKLARSVAGVLVVEVANASKVAALNAGDCATSLWPRLYLDADIELPVPALSATLKALSGEQGLLCARPAFRYDTDGASWLVKAYYRARNRLPQSSASMWGAGVYGLSRTGHQRLGKFPDVSGDDCLVDRLFEGKERAVVDCLPVTVRTPRSSKALLMTLKRVYRGNSELGELPGSTQRTVTELAASVHSPASALDALVYTGFALAGRLAPRPVRAWERDESSRVT
ncbi:glycosyltransferase family 2 protein [Arthrobacter sp. OV608]|uniref:glycosyltransferase family 2 protein n=1 Tax=Arthrobacter sp. OV608 TaxID=1882768 RepID=UPI0008B59F20|nr:glycosyltransferase family 2 protein [Arthrobacter sp. OV608]SEQ51159.1 Glycosyltransferase, GT2 family [Arthrobacter sp. OV608]